MIASQDSLKIKKDQLSYAIQLFNTQQWYKAHDAFEEIWHESIGRERLVVQAILQVSVAYYHFGNGNRNGAMILIGEALGRLKQESSEEMDFDLDIKGLCLSLETSLLCLHRDEELDLMPYPSLRPTS